MKKLICLILLLSFTSVIASESDTYNFSWLDPDKEVYVLQNRKFRKAGSFHLYAGGGKTLNGAFVDATTLQARAGYYFFEEYGFEAVYGKNSGKENNTAANVRDNGQGIGSRPFRRIIDNYMGAMFLWSPFYSKINTFNTIIYYDWIFGVGFANVQETNNTEEFQNSAGVYPSQTEKHTGIMWDIGIKIFFGGGWSSRIDVTAVHYKAPSPVVGDTQKLWNDNYDLSFSLGYNF